MFLPLPPGGHRLYLLPSLRVPLAQLWVDGTVRRWATAGGAVSRLAEQEVEAHWSFQPSNDSTRAELWALEAALEHFDPARLHGAIIYTDSFQALEHLQNCQAGKGSRYEEAPGILRTLTSRGVCCLQNIDRKLNKRADALARKGLPGGR